MAHELRCIQYTNSYERGNSYDVSHGGSRLSYICRKLLMEAAVLTLHQVILMMLLIAVGIACARLKWFSDEVAQALSRFLLWFVTPALLINAFSRDYNAPKRTIFCCPVCSALYSICWQQVLRSSPFAAATRGNVPLRA